MQNKDLTFSSLLLHHTKLTRTGFSLLRADAKLETQAEKILKLARQGQSSDTEGVQKARINKTYMLRLCKHLDASKLIAYIKFQAMFFHEVK